MKQLVNFIDLKNLIYLITTVGFVMAWWFGFHERIAVLAADVTHNHQKLAAHQSSFKDIHHELKMLNDTVIRIQVLLEEQLKRQPPFIK